MRTTTKILVKSTIILSLAALVPQISSAQAPSGSLTNVVTGTTNALFDLSLVQALQNIEMNMQKETTAVRVFYTNLFSQNGRGKLAGIATNDVSLIIEDNSTNVTTVSFPGVCTSKGSLTSAKGVLRLAFSSKAAGVADFDGATHKVAAASTYTVKLDANAGQVSGRTSQHASASGGGSISDHGTIGPEPLPEELGGGSWTLVLNFTGTNATKLSGDASVTLQTGQVYPFTMKGIFSPKNQQSKLNLKGVDAGLGSSLLVTLRSNEVTRVVGRVSGQSVNIK